MTRKQLQTLISAGVFSATLLSGAVYADDTPAKSNTPDSTTSGTSPDQPPAPKSETDQPSKDASDKSTTQDGKQKTSDSKGAAQQGCSSANGCGSH